METNKSEPDLYLKELREINWFNTSEAKVKEAYNGWASTYDKVRINIILFGLLMDAMIKKTLGSLA